MAAARTDTPAADTVVARRRGKSKAPNFNYEGPVSVIRLELDVSETRSPTPAAAVGRGVSVAAGVAA
jgi:hypothetical protein